MIENTEAPSSRDPETAAEIRVLLSAEENGRIPFPEGSYREIAAFLEALSRLDKKGCLDHRLQNGYFACYLTESGHQIRAEVVAAQCGMAGASSGGGAEPGRRGARATEGAVSTSGCS